MPALEPAPLTWQMGFFAMTLVLGDSADDARARLRTEDAAALPRVAGEAGPEGRKARSRQLAAILQVVTADLEALRLA
jgi:hypothetical protein